MVSFVNSVRSVNGCFIDSCCRGEFPDLLLGQVEVEKLRSKAVESEIAGPALATRTGGSMKGKEPVIRQNILEISERVKGRDCGHIFSKFS